MFNHLFSFNKKSKITNEDHIRLKNWNPFNPLRLMHTNSFAGFPKDYSCRKWFKDRFRQFRRWNTHLALKTVTTLSIKHFHIGISFGCHSVAIYIRKYRNEEKNFSYDNIGIGMDSIWYYVCAHSYDDAVREHCRF